MSTMNTTVVSRIDIKDKAKGLDNTSLYDVHLHSQYTEINNLRNYLFRFLCSKDQQFSRKNKTKNKAQIKNLIINLYKTYYEDQARYIAISRRKEHYSKINSRYNKLFIKYIIVAAVNLLHKYNYIEYHPGYLKRSTGKGRVSRIKAAPKLINLFNNRNLRPHMIQRLDETEVIIMKDAEDKKEIAYKETDFTIQMRQALIKYNTLLDKTYIDIPWHSENGIKIKKSENKNEERVIYLHQSDKFIRRIFNNNNWEDGGRYYGGWWQRIPSEKRQGIHFGTTPTSEIDYSGLHVKLLYLLCGKDLKEDPYTIPGIESNEWNRRIIKITLLNLINARDKKDSDRLALSAAQNKINFDIDLYNYYKENQIVLKDYARLIKKHHRKINDFFNTGIGIKLQGFDSMMAEAIINHFTEIDIPILCIHDSFVIAADKTELLDVVMQEKFYEICSSLDLKTKGSAVKLKGMGLGEFQTWLTHPDYRDIMIDNWYKLEYQYPVWAKNMKEFKEKHTSGFCTE